MAQNTQKGKIMTHTVQPSQHATSRRSFLRKGLAAGGAGAIGAALLANGVPAFAEAESGGLTPGDAAILPFQFAAATLETEVLQQNHQLGGPPVRLDPRGGGGGGHTELR